MEITPYIVYVQTDDQNRIISVNSSAFLADVNGWTEIDRGVGDKYHHAQGNYFTKPIIDERGVFRYKMVDGEPIERSQDDMNGDISTLEIDAFPIDVLGDHEYRICMLELGIGGEI